MSDIIAKVLDNNPLNKMDQPTNLSINKSKKPTPK